MFASDDGCSSSGADAAKGAADMREASGAVVEATSEACGLHVPFTPSELLHSILMEEQTSRRILSQLP